MTMDTKPCECHGVPQIWRNRADLPAGGYYTCRVKRREAQRRYAHTEKGKAANRKYNQSEKGTARQKRWRSTEQALALKREWNFLNR